MSTSNSAHFGILPTFDHHSQTWKTFISRLTQWFVANKINATTYAGGVQRRAILLSTLNDGTYKLAADLALPKKIEEVPYEDVLQLLENHFVPKVFGFSERYKFYSAVQQSGETHTQWAARLRGLSAECEFTNLEEVLRDRFVMGMLPGRERDKVFTQDLKDPNSPTSPSSSTAADRDVQDIGEGEGEQAVHQSQESTELTASAPPPDDDPQEEFEDAESDDSVESLLVGQGPGDSEVPVLPSTSVGQDKVKRNRPKVNYKPYFK